MEKTCLIKGYIIDGETIINEHTGETIPDMPFTVLKLSVRPYNVLRREESRIRQPQHNELFISDLLLLEEDEMRGLRNMGAKSADELLSEIRRYLDQPDQYVQREPARITEETEDLPETIELLDIDDLLDTDVFFESEEVEENKETGRKDNGITSFFQYAEGCGKLKRQQLEVLRHRKSGEPVSDIAAFFDISRARLYQVEKRAFEVLTQYGRKQFAEDQFAYLYQTYQVPKELFTEYMGQSGETLYYLSVRYSHGKLAITEAAEDENLTQEIREAVRRYGQKDLIIVGEDRISRNRNDIEEYLLRNCCRDDVTLEGFAGIYDRFIAENGLEESDFASSEVYTNRSRINRFVNASNVLWKQNQRMRYYDTDRDFTELLKTLDLGQYRDIELSARKFLIDYPKLMEKYDIRDEYELHNLLKKLHAEKRNKTLQFERMPFLLFGSFDRDQAVKDLIYANSPLTTDELAKLISRTYGANVDTIKAGWLKGAADFFHHGLYVRPVEDDPAEPETVGQTQPEPAKTGTVSAVYAPAASGRKKVLTPREKLFRRIRREFPNKKLIGDIVISDEEFEILKQYFRSQCRYLLTQCELFECDEMLCVTLVQIGIRYYSDGKYWPFVRQILNAPQYRDSHFNWLGNSFLDYMRRREKILAPEKKAIANILLHGFVSDQKAHEFFDFLHMFYDIDLRRDIQLLKEDKTLMAGLIDNIKASDTRGRTYKLLEHTADAIRYNEKGGRIRLRRYLKLIHRAIWDQDDLPRQSGNRLTRYFLEWNENSEKMKEERRTGKSPTGKARNGWAPYLRYDYKKDEFRIILPERLIHSDDEPTVTWEIRYGDFTRSVPTDAFEAVTGYLTEERTLPIEKQHLFDSFGVTLLSSAEPPRNWKIRQDRIRFFDMSGDQIEPASLRPGEVISFSDLDYLPESEVIQETQKYGGLVMCTYTLEEGDLIIFPDKQVLSIGRRPTEGLLTRGLQQDVYALDNDRQIPVFSLSPSIFARIHPRSMNGTQLKINGKIHRLFDEGQPMEGVHVFELKERTPEEGVQISLSRYGVSDNGLYHVELDIPTDHSDRRWDFMLINGLVPVFDEAPYIFRDHGILCVPEETGLKALDRCRQETEDGQCRFAFEIPEDDDWFRLCLGDTPILFSIPKLSYRFQGEEKWQTKLHLPVWHKDLPRILEVRYPADSIRFLLDEEGNDEDDDEQHSIDCQKSKEKDIIICDLNPLTSYYGKRVAMRRLYIQVPGMDKPIKFLNIYTKSVLMNALLTMDLNNDVINAEFDIHGKAQYYADIWYGDELILGKGLIRDGKLSVHTEIRSGIYRTDVFETDDDGFGFDDPEFELLGSRSMELLNPADLTGRHIEVTHLEIRGIDSYLRLKRDYRLYDLKQRKDLGKGYYSGHMVVTAKVSGEHRNDYEAFIHIPDPEELTRAYLFVLDEYGDEESFIYDNDRYIMRKDEDETVKGVFKYRRFLYLIEDVYEFRIGFVEKPEGLDTKIAEEQKKREQREQKKAQEAKMLSDLQKQDPLSISTARLGLSVRAYNALNREGIRTSTELYLRAMSSQGLERIRHLGRKEIEECIYRLRKAGYSI